MTLLRKKIRSRQLEAIRETPNAKYPPTRSGERIHVERDLFGRMHYREENWGENGG